MIDKKYYNIIKNDASWWTADHDTTAPHYPRRKIKKGRVAVPVRGILIPNGLSVLKCECEDTRSRTMQYHEAPQPSDLRLIVRKDIRDYLDEKRIYTYAVRDGIAMDKKDLAIILLKFK